MNKNIRFAIKSWKGKRPVNQDALVCGFNLSNDFCAVVCDGVGSVVHSEYASKIVSQTFMDSFEKTKNIDKPTGWFKETLAKALVNLKMYGTENQLPNIATTLALLIIVGDKFYAYNVGDTRIYGFIGSELKQYSYDHNYKNYLISNDASQDELNMQKDRWHALTNFVDASNPDAAKFDANSGTIDKHMHFLLATDGLYGYANDYSIINKQLPVALKLSLLMKKASSNGSDDNISGILISVK